MSEYLFVSEYPISEESTFPLSFAKFTKYKTSISNLNKIYLFEEMYDQIVQSYVDYKTYNYQSCIQFSSQADLSKNQGYEYKLKLNRILSTTLNLCKFYLDKSYSQETSFVFKLTGEQSDQSKVAKFRNSLFQRNDGYAIGDDLRNYAQHHSKLIESFTYGFHKKTIVLYSCMNKTKLIDFIKDRKPAKATKERLLSVVEANCYKDKGFDIQRILDQFMNGVGEIHKFNRSLYTPLITEYVSNLEEAHSISPESQLFCLLENGKRIPLNYLRLKETIDHIINKNLFPLNHELLDTSTYPPIEF
ncbi:MULTISPECIES: hypothetical protein [unclassified Agarivorans]|uniref:hypothetical protein n=1 Tax=unclassified Agarivorans TaxID=2636026 RepID=UPI0026E3F3FB|nr:MULTISPECIES: hypothetical protein [unclassified Agarivorans]MDO6687600.1 hypothetical protein [Agarivorans sp. 3_MG-2023]MDO6717067.1 hypothetical protein [Agarivorans sp. 2_MG-2023]